MILDALRGKARVPRSRRAGEKKDDKVDENARVYFP